MVYLGTMTPFKDIGLHARATMGGYARVYRVFGGVNVASYWSLKTEEGVAKIHNDLYVFADTINDSLSAWESVLQAISDYNLSPSAEKAQILPTTTTLKDWK